ncbi:MAG: zinc ribbon domain-containing protein [Thermodesulfovibrionales bacterium]|nr:zinc ribbon domain-containing protein [Thermodesulfovibrionales bacterium]
MPIFEYKCKKCNKEFEKLVFGEQKICCPNCSSEDVCKKFSLFSMSGVQSAASSGCSTCSSSSCSSCK